MLHAAMGRPCFASYSVGPHATCCLPGLQIKLGTLDQPHAETEWALRSYTRSAKKSKLAAAEEEET